MSAWEDHFREFLLKRCESVGRIKSHDVITCPPQVYDLNEAVVNEDGIETENIILPSQEELKSNQKVLTSFNSQMVSGTGNPSQLENKLQQKQMKVSSSEQAIISTRQFCTRTRTFLPNSTRPWKLR